MGPMRGVRSWGVSGASGLVLTADAGAWCCSWPGGLTPERLGPSLVVKRRPLPLGFSPAKSEGHSSAARWQGGGVAYAVSQRCLIASSRCYTQSVKAPPSHALPGGGGGTAVSAFVKRAWASARKRVWKSRCG